MTTLVQNFYPKVSIIIPVYNGSNYLLQAIDSALAQTYFNIEIIVINDGSTDKGKTQQIAQSYGNKIKYYHKDNGGCASALNLGIRFMTGEYFSWLSHDDLYLPNKIERQVSLLRHLNNKNTIIYGERELIDKNSKIIKLVKPTSFYDRHKLDIALFPVLRGLINGCTLLIPKIYFDQVGLFDETLKSTQDYAMWFKMFRVAEIKFLDEILVKSRVHAGQGTRTIKNHQEECNVMWIEFLTTITKAEREKLEGSDYMFYLRTAEFLKKTPYEKAYAYALKLLKMVPKEIAEEVLEVKKEKLSIKKITSRIVDFIRAIYFSFKYEDLSSSLNRIRKKITSKILFIKIK